LERHVQVAHTSALGSSQVVARTTGLLFEVVALVSPSADLALLNNLSVQRRQIQIWRRNLQQLEQRLQARAGRDFARLCCLSALPLSVLGCFGSNRTDAIEAGHKYFTTAKTERSVFSTSDVVLERLLSLEAEDLDQAMSDAAASSSLPSKAPETPALIAWLAASNKHSLLLRRITAPVLDATTPCETSATSARFPSIYHIDGESSLSCDFKGSAYTLRECGEDEPGARCAKSAFLSSLRVQALSCAGKPINRAYASGVRVTRVLELIRPYARQAFVALGEQMQELFDPTRTCPVEHGVMFHGTAWGSLHSICSFGLQPNLDIKNGQRLGAGICTTPIGGLALHYAELSKSRSDRQEFAVLVCRVLRGHGKRADSSGLWQREHFATASAASFALPCTSSVAFDVDQVGNGATPSQICVRAASQVLVEYILCCQIGKS
jgi:hypothetical protein